MAGLRVLLSMLLLLESHTPEHIRGLADSALPGLLRRDTGSLV
jgi:hypothetical protein